jgi:MFS family permease
VGLSAVNFFLADVNDGLGPFLATWLAEAAHWDPARIGLVMTIAGIAGLVCNGPAGGLVDRLDRPRLLLALAGLAVVTGTLALLVASGFAAVLASQVVVAVGGAVMGPALVALTLGLVGKAEFPTWQGRIQAWNHAGNVAAALLVVGATFVLGPAAAFWVLAGMAAGSFGALSLIPSEAVKPARAERHDAAQPAASLRSVLTDRRVVALGVALLAFHLGNAAMLPLLGQRMAAIGEGNPTRWMAACVIVAQLTMVPVALVAGRMAGRVDRAWLLVAACAVLPVRGVLAALATNPAWLLPVQILDACGAGTLGVAVPLLVADYTWGSGRTQTALGAVATAQGIGASLSATVGGLLATWFGWGAAFLGLTVPAALALALALRLAGQAPRLKAASIKARV